MSELEHALCDRDQAGLLCRVERFGIDLERAERLRDLVEPARSACRGDEQRLPRRRWERLDLTAEGAFHRWGWRQRLVDRLPAGELALVEECGRLDERERIALRRADELLGDLGGRLRAEAAREQPQGVVPVEADQPA